MIYVDLNADLGEGYQNDSEILKYVSSANIACGLHAGSPDLMLSTVKMAIEKGVSIGAHPGYNDREGFGRREIDMPFEVLKALIKIQIMSLKGITEKLDAKLVHVKAHGALYNSGAKNKDIAEAIVLAVYELDKQLLIFGPAGSEIESASKRYNMSFVSEAFADRAYNIDGSLVSRTEPGAMIRDVSECSARVIRMLKEGKVKTINNKSLSIKAETICLHGDGEEALQFAQQLKQSLSDAGIIIKAPAQN